MRKVTKEFIVGRIYTNFLDPRRATYFEFVKIDFAMGGIYFKYVGGVDCYFPNEDGLIGFIYPLLNARYLLSKKEVSKLQEDGIIKLQKL